MDHVNAALIAKADQESILDFILMIAIAQSTFSEIPVYKDEISFKSRK